MPQWEWPGSRGIRTAWTGLHGESRDGAPVTVIYNGRLRFQAALAVDATLDRAHHSPDDYPRTDLVRGRQLVSARALAAWIAAGAIDPRWRIVEMVCGASHRFAASHIPGAACLDTGAIEGGPLWNKVPDDALLRVLLAQGIRHDTTVILYGRNNLAAARAAHLLLYAGVADVRLLDGGFGAWQAGGYPCESGPARPVDAVDDFGLPFPAHPEYLVDMAQARALLGRPDAALVSIRSEAEYLGKVSGYSYIAARGDIAGALWGRAGADGDVNSMNAYQRDDGTMRPAGEIAAMWELGGITADRRVAFYCGTGWRASLAFFQAWLMGWEKIAVYDGGWLEWSSDGIDGQRCAVGMG